MNFSVSKRSSLFISLNISQNHLVHSAILADPSALGILTAALKASGVISALEHALLQASYGVSWESIL